MSAVFIEKSLRFNHQGSHIWLIAKFMKLQLNHSFEMCNLKMIYLIFCNVELFDGEKNSKCGALNIFQIIYIIWLNCTKAKKKSFPTILVKI